MKQTSVSQSSTASELISLDAGFPMDGIPALDFLRCGQIKKKEQQCNEYTESSGIDGEAIEFEWHISQDSHRLRFSVRSKKIW